MRFSMHPPNTDWYDIWRQRDSLKLDFNDHVLVVIQYCNGLSSTTIKQNQIAIETQKEYRTLWILLYLVLPYWWSGTAARVVTCYPFVLANLHNIKSNLLWPRGTPACRGCFFGKGVHTMRSSFWICIEISLRVSSVGETIICVTNWVLRTADRQCWTPLIFLRFSDAQAQSYTVKRSIFLPSLYFFLQ